MGRNAACRTRTRTTRSRTRGRTSGLGSDSIFLLSNDRALETLQGQRKNGNGVSTFHMKKAKCEIYPLLSVMSL